MAAVEYGTIGIRPMGGWDPDTKYDLLNLVDYDGSSYVAHMDPPKGSLPTDTNYWQTSAQGTSKATADSVGTVKPDGTTTEVSTDGSLSVKTATQDALGLVKGSDGINVGSDGSIDLNTAFTQATELANIIAEEAIASVLGKISKSIAVTMNLDQNALLKNMLTNMDANDPNKINTAAYVHTLTERIGMGEELTAGANLTDGLNTLNSNLNNINGSLNNVNSNLTVSDITFSPNMAGLTSHDMTCKRYGKVGVLTGTFTPNQAGTPLTLGNINVTLASGVSFVISGYEKVSSYGVINTVGNFICNIPSVMANGTCAVNIVFLIA